MTSKKMNVKMLLKSIFAIVMVAALLLGCIACSTTSDKGDDKPDTGNTDTGNNGNNVSKYEGLTDVEYAQTLTQDALDGAVDALAAGVSAYTGLLGATSGSTGAEAELTLNLGDMLIDMVEQTIFGTTESGMDMSFLSSIGLDMQIDSTEDMAQLQIALELASKKIVDLLVLTDGTTLWAAIPELADGYLELNLADMVAVSAGASAYLEKLLGALPSEETLAKILKRYVLLAVKEIETVERTTETLTVDGLSQEANKLTIKIYEQDALDAGRAVLTAIKDDKDIKKIADDFSKCYNELMEEAYAELGEYDVQWEEVDFYTDIIEAIDSALEELPAEAETETYIALTLYTDKKHNVIGFDFTIPEDEAPLISAYTVTDGDKFASVCKVESIAFEVTGKGTTKNGVITGTYTITTEGVSFITIELKDFDNTDKDAVSGTVILKPTADAMDALFDGAIPYLGVEDVALELTLDITNDKADVEAKLIGDDAMILGIALKLATKTPGIIQKPTDTVDVTDYTAFMTWVASIDFNKAINNLGKAGVPDALLSALQGLVPAA